VATSCSQLVDAAQQAGEFSDLDDNDASAAVTSVVGNKVFEFEQQMKIMRLEKELNNARKNLFGMRKQQYQQKGPVAPGSPGMSRVPPGVAPPNAKRFSGGFPPGTVPGLKGPMPPPGTQPKSPIVMHNGPKGPVMLPPGVVPGPIPGSPPTSSGFLQGPPGQNFPPGQPQPGPGFPPGQPPPGMGFPPGPPHGPMKMPGPGFPPGQGFPPGPMKGPGFPPGPPKGGMYGSPPTGNGFPPPGQMKGPGFPPGPPKGGMYGSPPTGHGFPPPGQMKSPGMPRPPPPQQ